MYFKSIFITKSHTYLWTREYGGSSLDNTCGNMDPLPPLPGQAFNPQADEEAAAAAANQLDADHQPDAVNNGGQPQQIIVPPPPPQPLQPPPGFANVQQHICHVANGIGDVRSRTQGVATVTTVFNAPYTYDGSPTTHDTLRCSRRRQSQCSASITILANIPASITSRYGLLNGHVLGYSDGIEGSMHSPSCEGYHNSADPGSDRLTVRLSMATIFPDRLNADGTRNHSVQEALRVPEDLLQCLIGQLGTSHAGRSGLFPWQQKHLLLRQMSQLVRTAFDDGLLVLPEVNAVDITIMCCCLHLYEARRMSSRMNTYGIDTNFDAGFYQQKPNLDEEEIIRVLDALQLWLENILYWVFSIVVTDGLKIVADQDGGVDYDHLLDQVSDPSAVDNEVVIEMRNALHSIQVQPGDSTDLGTVLLDLRTISFPGGYSDPETDLMNLLFVWNRDRHLPPLTGALANSPPARICALALGRRQASIADWNTRRRRRFRNSSRAPDMDLSIPANQVIAQQVVRYIRPFVTALLAHINARIVANGGNAVVNVPTINEAQQAAPAPPAGGRGRGRGQGLNAGRAAVAGRGGGGRNAGRAAVAAAAPRVRRVSGSISQRNGLYRLRVTIRTTQLHRTFETQAEAEIARDAAVDVINAALRSGRVDYLQIEQEAGAAADEDVQRFQDIFA